MKRRIRVIAALSLAVGLAGAALPASALAVSPASPGGAPPSISAVFTPSSTSTNAAVALVFTITNSNPVLHFVAGVEPNVYTGALSSVAFTDNLPAHMMVATPNGLTGDCGGGSAVAVAGSSSITLTGGVIAAASSCTITVSVVAAFAGYYTNTTGAVTADETAGTNTATAHLSVGYLPPTITETFGASSIVVGGTTSLTFIVTNPNTVPTPEVAVRPAAGGVQLMPLTGVGFTDTLPAGLAVATPNGLTGTCGGGTITADAGSATVKLVGATLAATASCTFALNVIGVTAGTKTNPTDPVTSTEGGAGNTGSAGLTVGAPAATNPPVTNPPVPPTSTTGGGSGSDSPLLPIMLLLASIAGLGTFLTLRRVREVRS